MTESVVEGAEIEMGGLKLGAGNLDGMETLFNKKGHVSVN